MKIDHAGREYVHIPVTGAPFDATPLEVSFDDGTVWNATDWNDDKTIATILVSGPDAPDGTGSVVLPLGRHGVQARLVDSPEVVIRDTGSVIEIRS